MQKKNVNFKRILFGVGACWNNSQRVILEECTDDSVGYYFIYP